MCVSLQLEEHHLISERAGTPPQCGRRPRAGHRRLRVRPEETERHCCIFSPAGTTYPTQRPLPPFLSSFPWPQALFSAGDTEQAAVVMGSPEIIN